MSAFIVYKLAAAGLLQFLLILQCLPPNTLSAKAGDKSNDKYFRVGSFTATKVVGVSAAVAALIIACDDNMGRQSLRQPWSTADVVYLALGVAGGLLRIWAMRVLAKQFTFEVGIVKDHKLVQSGPYQWVRHPGYTGGILSGMGTLGFLGLRLHGLAWWVLFAVPMTAFMAARISNEEQTLHQHFGAQWEQHCKRTWRLFPPLL